MVMVGYPPVTYGCVELMNAFLLRQRGMMRAVGGKLTAEESRHISLLGMNAVLQVFQRFNPLLSGKGALVRADN